MVKIQVNPLEATTGYQLNLAEFMQEHADYERKSADYALAILGKFPDQASSISTLANIGRDTIAIYADLCEIMEQRGIQLIPEVPQNLYLKQLGWLGRSGRKERFMDRLILGSIAESRCAKRFREIAENIDDRQLSGFYEQCAAKKQEHADRYLQLAYQSSADAESVALRLAELSAEEEKVMASQSGVSGIF